MTIQIFRQIAKGIADHADEISATRDRTTEATHDIPLREIIGYHQHLAIVLEAMRGALDQIVRRLAAAGKNHLNRAAGLTLWLPASGAGAIKKDRHRGAGGVLIMSEEIDERIPRCLGMSGCTLSQFRPTVQQ